MKTFLKVFKPTLLGLEVNSDFLKTRPEKYANMGSSLALNHKFFMLTKVERRPKGPQLMFFFGTMQLFPVMVF